MIIKSNTVLFGRRRQLRKHLYTFLQSVSLLALSFGIQAQNVGSRSLQDTAAVADTELNEIVITS
ncbi:MAG: hypothetical protein LBQ01_00860, partial [Prevotellaceae bacterium]|nr:hypothetical protein [Prevotellaceae bacterium]